MDCAYLRWNTHSHRTTIEDSNPVSYSKIAVAACIDNNLLSCTTVTNKQSAIGYFQYFCTYGHIK